MPVDTSTNYDIPLHERTKPCDRPGCHGQAYMEEFCGAWVCGHCQKHAGLTRCYCGWSESGGDGRQELIDMGETIDDDY